MAEQSNITKTLAVLSVVLLTVHSLTTQQNQVEQSENLLI